MPLMKKLLITLAIIAAILLTIPFIGNKFIESEIDNRINVLTSYGLTLKESKTDFRYFYTKKYLIFKVEDVDNFVSYLNLFSDSKLPLYLNVLVDEIEFGLDLKYSNFPTSDFISLDIYPNALPIKVVSSLKTNDIKFYEYLDALLKTKSISYHLNYHILNNDFDGYLKDIDTSYSSPGGTQFNLKLLGAIFKGNGMVIAPKAVRSKIKEMKFSIKNKKDLDFGINVKNLALDFSSNEEALKDTFYNKINFERASVKTFQSIINIDKFNYDAILDGMVLEILDLSIKNLYTLKTKDLGELSIKSRVVFKEDKDFVNKVNKGLKNIMESMDIDLEFKMSKNMYSRFSLVYPILSLIEGLSKDSDEFILFDVKLKDSKLNVNGHGM